ncbi:MAG: hypothetical protein KAT90_00505 [Gammaproteobacteria bacterium]|nr:hypothetical protein [Gammaproteobacteria bacterium]
MTNILLKGTEIRCPRKRHLIGVASTDLHGSGSFRFQFINFEQGQERIAGEQAKCKLCNSAYIAQDKIHTDGGWFPSDPKLEPVPMARK